MIIFSPVRLYGQGIFKIFRVTVSCAYTLKIKKKFINT